MITTNIHCEQCEHKNVCKYVNNLHTQLGEKIESALKNLITDPVTITVSCPFYQQSHSHIITGSQGTILADAILCFQTYA